MFGFSAAGRAVKKRASSGTIGFIYRVVSWSQTEGKADQANFGVFPIGSEAWSDLAKVDATTTKAGEAGGI